MKDNQTAPAGKNGAGKSRTAVLAEIQQLEQAGAARKLRGYLMELARHGDQPRQYEELFARYLASPEADLREAAVYCLLFTLRIQKPAYRRAALALATDEAQDFDVRLWAGTGLAVAYQRTQDPGLLAAFLAVIDDQASDRHLKVSAVRNIALLVGISSRGQWLRAQSDSLSVLQEEFAAELATARRLARGH